MVKVVYELEICADCAVVIVNGDDSADPERAAAAFDAAYGVWGDDLSKLVVSDSQGDGHGLRIRLRGEHGGLPRALIELPACGSGVSQPRYGSLFTRPHTDTGKVKDHD